MGFESRDKGVTVQLGPVAGALGRVSFATFKLGACRQC